MAGLLDLFTGDNADAMIAVGGGLLSRSPAAGFARAQNLLNDLPMQRMRAQLLQSQIDENNEQVRVRQMLAQREQAALEQAARVREGIPGLFKQPGMTGGAPVPQTEGGVPMFSKPMGVSPMQQTPGGFDVQGALRLGLAPEQISALAGLQNIGRQKVARTAEVDDGRGGKMMVQLDEFGAPVGQGMAGYTAPVQVNQGDRVSFVKPAPGVTLGMNMSPEGRDASARGWAGFNETKRHNNVTETNAGATAAAGRVPAGYRAKPDGSLEFIPGGPADPNAAKKAAPTEFQGKAGMFGARAAEADKIITGLDGKYSPAAINAKKALGNVWGVGGALESVGNAALTDSGQKAEQAERDFINAILRLESGAAIGKDEFANARQQYFPQPFDSAAVKAQKAANRKMAIQGLQDNARATAPTAQQPQQGGATGSFDPGNDPLGLRK